MNHREGELEGVGGIRLYRQSWLPDGPPRAVVVIAHGAGEHSGRYAHVAVRLVDEGYAVYALDHRGHGRSEGPRAVIDRIDNAADDLDRLIMLAASEQPGVPLFLLGHSMGGTISVRHAMAHQDRLTGLILSAPLAALEAASPVTRLVARVLSALTPSLGLFAVDPELVSRDPDVVKEYETDPLVHHDRLPARTIAELASAVESFPEAAGAITVPTLIMYGSGDHLVPPAGSMMLNDRIGAPDKKLNTYDGLYHEILNEPEQDAVMDDLCSWLRARVRATVA
ncbi:MAG: lysophospholipase [Actinobacteria bacterium]|nr:MAG: lysophospholipase [Actinomycetota bacterium]